MVFLENTEGIVSRREGSIVMTVGKRLNNIRTGKFHWM